MKIKKCFFIVNIFILCCLFTANAQKNIDIEPVHGTLDRPGSAGWTNGGVWIDQHKDISEIGKKKKVDLVFLGNSITQSWCSYDRNVWGPGQKVWDKYYKHRNAANFGISGDRVENILWRIENGNLDQCTPKVVVLLAGTNNLKESSSEYIIKGVQEIVTGIHKKSPKTKILVLGILPRGENPDAEFRGKIEKINQSLEKLDKAKRTWFKDVSEYFLTEDGTARKDLYRGDFIHLSAAGYKAWSESIEPILKKLL